VEFLIYVIDANFCLLEFMASNLYFLGLDDTGTLSKIERESDYINKFKSYQKQAVICQNVTDVILKL
jgi:hypothetical protein